jgi:hypothetical protein
MERQRLAKNRLLTALPPDGAAGATEYCLAGAAPAVDVPWLGVEERDEIQAIAERSETGSVLFAHDSEVVLVIPPFNVEHASVIGCIDTAPLLDLLEHPRAYAAFLLRRGGYTIGFFRGDFLADSKTDRRFVKNRHKAGGQSQRRFDRIREKQIHELFGKACEDLRETLAPHEKEIEHLFLGGDRQSLIAFRKQCDYLDRTYGGRIAGRMVPVTSDPRRASLDGVPREVWSSDVYRVSRVAPASGNW